MAENSGLALTMVRVTHGIFYAIAANSIGLVLERVQKQNIPHLLDAIDMFNFVDLQESKGNYNKSLKKIAV